MKTTKNLLLFVLFIVSCFALGACSLATGVTPDVETHLVGPELALPSPITTQTFVSRAEAVAAKLGYYVVSVHISDTARRVTVGKSFMNVGFLGVGFGHGQSTVTISLAKDSRTINMMATDSRGGSTKDAKTALETLADFRSQLQMYFAND